MAKLENGIPRVGNKVVLLRKVFEMPSGTIATVTECDDGIFYRVESVSYTHLLVYAKSPVLSIGKVAKNEVNGLAFSATLYLRGKARLEGAPPNCNKWHSGLTMLTR